MNFFKNLTVGGWLVLALVVGGGIYGATKLIPDSPAIAQVGGQGSSTAEGVIPVTNPSPTPSDVKVTNVQVDLPERPISGIMKGVVEVGASGFNSFVINIDNQKRWEIVSKDFGESLAYEGFATVEDVKIGLKKYLGQMFNKGVSGRNVHFVMSSGALKNPKTQDVAKAIEQMGYVVNRVTADQEGKYALKAALPPAYRNDSYVVDMGSGNTKISWYEGASLKTVEAPGAKYYQNNLKDEDVFAEISTKVKDVPESKRGKCFIIGGVPFILAKESRVNSTDRFTILAAPDAYSAGDDVKKRSGLNIYKALVEGSGTNTFVFDWDANFTIGFLMSLN